MISAEKEQLPCIDIYQMETIKTIGQGNTGQVVIAKLPKSDKVYAIKQFKSDKTVDLNNEITSLKALKHKNIIEMLAFNDKSVVFEYFSNGELYDIILKQKMTERIGKFYFKELMGAVKYIHEQGYSHRDIKLENILISNDFNIILADFGFASQIIPGQKFSRIMGTSGYMAPELQLRQKYCGKKVDIFASGVVLFCMVTGIPPFNQATSSDPHYRLFVNNTQQYWSWIKKCKINVSEDFKDLINRILSFNENERLSASEILGHSWFQEKIECSYQEASQYIKEIIQRSK